jgi:L-malate glycosyltransferase
VKVLTFAHRLELGGTQVNAIELAAALRDRHGFTPVLFATPGPAGALAEQRGLRVLPAPEARAHPSPARARALRDAVRREQPDLVHVWDWPQCLDGYYGVHLPWRTPFLCTVMDMVVPRLLPRALPTTFGTPELVDRARAAGRPRVDLLLPPVDTDHNSLDAADPAAVEEFRTRHGLGPADITLVTVARLVHWLKGESLRRSIDAVRVLGRELPVRLVIVGEGPARDELQRRADGVNETLGQPAVVLAGPLVDPRPAYAAADVVLGMGGSALRGMAFGRPVVVLGERGFSEPFTAETAPGFRYRGIYGVGDGAGGGSADDQAGTNRLAANLAAVAGQPDRWDDLGQLGRDFVVENFGLPGVSDLLARYCQQAVDGTPSRRVILADAPRTGALNALRSVRAVPNRVKASVSRSGSA